MSKPSQKVNWDELKENLGDRYYEAESPLPALEKNIKLNDKCDKVTFVPGDEIISPQKQLDGIYILLDGIVAVGDRRIYGNSIQKTFYVQSLTLRPFSFIGEIEAPMEIRGIQFPNLEAQQYAWVTSDILSRVMAYRDDPVRLKVTSGNKSDTFKNLVRWLDKGLLERSDFVNEGRLTEEERIAYHSKPIEEVVGGFTERRITLPSEKMIFSRNAKATFLRIPIEDAFTGELWKDEALRRLVCEDAFIKNKKYWLMPQEGQMQLQRTIVALYHHAELNNLLIDGNLYILGIDKIRAITNRTDVQRDTNQSTIKKYLNDRGYSWITSDDSKDKEEVFIKDPDILDVYNFMTLGQGGNKEIFKVKRVRNT